MLAVIVPLLFKYFHKIHTGWFVLVLPTVLFIYFIQLIPTVSDGETIFHSLAWVPSLGIYFNIYIDGLSLIFGLLITGIGALVILYSIYYLSKKGEPLHNFYVYLLMFMGAMLGIVFSDNLVVLYVFWELTSLASSLLIGYWYERERSRYGAQKSLLITVLGGFAMLAGFSLLYVVTGSFSIREIIEQTHVVVASTLFIPAMLLILAGAFTKSAQFPFHIWLPDAMEAPTPVSAYLHSATMVKAGIYLVARMSPIFAGASEWFWIIICFGMFTLLWGSFNAVRQTDLKAMLAYSTISQLGLIMSLLGFGSAAAHYGYIEGYLIASLAAVFHLINHATFKGALFMVAGIVDHETGTRDLRRLGGLMTVMPITFTLTLIGSFSMAGIYPFNGFLSKEMFFTGVLNAWQIGGFNLGSWGLAFIAGAWLASVFTFVYCMILVFKTFTGKLQHEQLEKEPHEAPLGMLISPIILVSLVVVLGFFPNILSYSLLEPAMQSIYPGILGADVQFDIHITPWHGWTTEIWMTIGVIIAGVTLYLTVSKWRRIYAWLRLDQRDPLDAVYDKSMDWLISGSTKITNLQMTGRLRDYFVYMGIFIIGILAYTIARFDAFPLTLPATAQIAPYMIVLALVFTVSTLSIPFIPHRITAILVTGVIGFMMALFFVFFRAPDLALTQLLVEIVMTALLLLCFYHLPELRKESFKPVFKWTNVIISVSIGAVITLLALSAYIMKDGGSFETISTYYTEHAYELAGGKNIVNVILVDFRALDTMLEITVLGIAALGLVSLIKLRMTGREDV